MLATHYSLHTTSLINLLAFRAGGGKQETPMELNLHPIATKCFVSGRDFQENDRVVSYLVRPSTGSGPGGEALRQWIDSCPNVPKDKACEKITSVRK